MARTGLGYAVRIWVYHAVLLLIGLLFISGIENDPVRIALDAALLAGAGLLVYSEGAYNGEKACTLGVTVEKQIKEGRPVDENMRAGVFNRKIAAWILILGAAPFLIVSAVNAAVAPFYPEVIMEREEEDESTLGSFEFDIDAVQDAKPQNVVNIFARLIFMPFVGVYPMVRGNLLNLLFFPFSLLLPAVSAAGYLSGPRMREKKLRDIARGKKRKMRNLKVHRKPRQPKAEV